MDPQIAPLEEIAGEWFVNRKEELEYFWTWANSVPLPGRHSIAFAGLRRTGKTAIIHRVFNRLFNEQDRVTPVYISFARYLNRPEPMTTKEFSQDFLGGYIASYLAFHYRRPALLAIEPSLGKLHSVAQEVEDEFILELFESYTQVQDTRFGSVSMNTAHWVIDQPRAHARFRNMPTAIFIDEFQLLTRVFNLDTNRLSSLNNAFQHASETFWAPIAVSGSSVNLLLGKATGGALSGRLRTRILGPLAEEHAVDMVMRLGQREGINVDEEFAWAIWELTQGYPYAIESLMTTVSSVKEDYPDLEALDEALAFELTNPGGLLFKHYNEEFTKYSTLLNEGQTTKKVMFWATKYPDEQIDTTVVAEQIGVDPKEVQNSLEKLEELDIVRRTTWSLYNGPTDPMLIRYIGFRHQRELEQLSEAQAAQNLQEQIRADRGHFSNEIGRLAEIVIGGVMRGFDGRTLDGETYFSHSAPVTTPKFDSIDNRWGVIEDGVPKELDLIGEHLLSEDDAKIDNISIYRHTVQRSSAWMVQVKYRQRKTSKTDVENFLQHVETVTLTKGYTQVARWYFSKGGYTSDAETLLREEGIYFSTLAQFNALAQQFGFLGLPS